MLRDVFLKLACPDKNGKSRKVYKSEFIGDFSVLYFTNGCNWMRSLKGYYNYVTSGRGNSWYIQLIGYDKHNYSRTISKNIYDFYKNKRCAHTGFKSSVQNPIEIDHKNGRYNEKSVLDINTQIIDDFQPLCR